MQKEYSNELTPDVKLKMKKNLVYVSIFSIVMIFAGFTSAYIVSMGDTFWLKYDLPLPFWISTIVIILSSIFYFIAVQQIKNGKTKQLKPLILITFILGLSFVYFQFKGYSNLVDKGANFINPILVTEGRYGDYFEVKYLNDFIEVNGNDYVIKGKTLNSKQEKEFKKFMRKFEKLASPSGYSISNLDPKFTLYYQSEPVNVSKNQLVTTSGKTLKYIEMQRLKDLALNVRDNRGDFFYKGKLGKDFRIYYKGKELSYKNRDLYFGNKKLSAPLQLKLNQSNDMATSYLYIITFLHLLHIVATIIYLFRMVLITFKPSLSSDNQLSIRLGSIFWHFLGILWLYLLVFLLFIH